MLRKKEWLQNNKYLRLLSDIGVFAIGNLLVKLIQYCLLPLYTSAMTTETYGTAELLNNLSEMLFPVVTLAVYEGVFRFAVDPDSDLDAILYESTGLVCKIFLGIFAVTPIFQRFIGYSYTYDLLFVLSAYSLRMLFAYYVRGSGYVKLFSFSGVVNAFSLAIFSWLFLVCFNFGVRGYLTALSCAHTASAVVLLIGAKIPKRLMLRKRNKALLVKMLQFSIPLIFNNVAWWITSMSGRYVVLFACGAGVAGLYTAANKLPAVISVISGIFQQAWQLNSAREYESGDQNAFYENVWKLYSVAIFLFGAAAIAITPVLAKITLKNEFFEARHYIPLMMLSVIILSLSAYFGSILIACKLTKAAMRGMALGAVINLVTAVALVGLLGVWGVLIASVFCYTAILIHRTVNVQRRLSMELHLKRLIFPFLLIIAETVLMCVGTHLTMGISWGMCAGIFGICIILHRNMITVLRKKAKQFLIGER